MPNKKKSILKRDIKLFKENRVVNFPDSPNILITLLSFFSGLLSLDKANLILLRPKFTVLLNNL